MTYNLSKIMKQAWQIVKSNPAWRKAGLKFWMRRALWQAWEEAKRALLTAEQKLCEDARRVLIALENKNWKTMTNADRAQLAELRRAA